ncbi:hypothetical protein Lal_00006232 [Lupinus albus]|nr:hypothetical protein Lal_00006232 [Lupinus albus]
MLQKRSRHYKEKLSESEVMPHAPDVKNPATAKPMTRAAGTKTGLKNTSNGAETASPIMVTVRVKKAKMRREAPKGTTVEIARIFEVEGAFFR